MKLTKKQYSEYVKRKSPRSPIFADLISAFIIGGGICCVGQLIGDILQIWLAEEDAASWTSIILVFLGAFLTGIGVYDRIAKAAGAGTLVPITGFANSVVSPALEFKSEGFITGTAAKIFAIAGPVILFGISASVIYGMLYYFFS